jgi:hypothetical protein
MATNPNRAVFLGFIGLKVTVYLKCAMRLLVAMAGRKITGKALFCIFACKWERRGENCERIAGEGNISGGFHSQF